MPLPDQPSNVTPEIKRRVFLPLFTSFERTSPAVFASEKTAGVNCSHKVAIHGDTGDSRLWVERNAPVKIYSISNSEK